jgi:hypothetical protein
MRQRFRPILETFETRELLSGLPFAPQSHLLQHRISVSTATVATPGQSQGTGIEASNQFVNPTGQPTAHERRRQRFVFKFSGPFLQGPGRFSDEKSMMYITGVGSSTYFLHGDLQLGAVVPTDPARPTSGLAQSFDRNTSASSSFGFSLIGDPTSLDRFGRPTHFNISTDITTSGGLFGESTSQGTLHIRYHPSENHRPGTFSEGRADVVIRGSAYTLGNTNNLAVIGIDNTIAPRKLMI